MCQTNQCYKSVTTKSAVDEVNIIIVEQINRFPVPKDEVNRLQQSVGDPSALPKAFILGHGLWSNLDVQNSNEWLDMIISLITHHSKSHWKGLLVTPNAAGILKPDLFLVAQGNKVITASFELLLLLVRNLC